MASADQIEPTDFEASLASALNQVGKSGAAVEEQMAEWLRETAYRPETGDPIYRRFLAAALWLESRPKFLVKGDGAEWEGRERAIAALRQRQREMDAELGIVTVPTARAFAGLSL